MFDPNTAHVEECPTGRCTPAGYCTDCYHPDPPAPLPTTDPWASECEAFNVVRQGMCKGALTDLGDCPNAVLHGDEFSAVAR